MVSDISYRLAVFDMDGTLLDTIEDLACAVNYALECSGMPQRSTAEVRNFVGNGIRQTLKLAAPAGTAQELLDRLYTDFTAYYEAHNSDHTVPYPGLTGLLLQLRHRHILTAVVSNKQDSAVHTLSEKFFPGLFDMTVGEQAGIRRKPAPDSVCCVLNALQISPADAVYIGDSEVDLQTAGNAGLPCISVAWGYRSSAALRSSGAVQIVGTAEALLSAILSREPVK